MMGDKVRSTDVAVEFQLTLRNGCSQGKVIDAVPSL